MFDQQGKPFTTRDQPKKVEIHSSESVTDIGRSDWFTRDVGEISHKVQDKVESINIDISNHFFKCLAKYRIESGLKQRLEYRNHITVKSYRSMIMPSTRCIMTIHYSCLDTNVMIRTYGTQS